MATLQKIWVSLRRPTSNKLIGRLLKYHTVNELRIDCHRWMSRLQEPKNETNLIRDGIIRSPFPDIITPNLTLEQFIWENLNLWPNHVAFECYATGRKYTFSQVRVLSRRFAESLRRQGLRPGDVLSILLPNGPDYPIILLGALEAGLIVSPMNPIYTSFELSHQLHDNGSSAIVTLPEFITKLNEAKKEIETKTNAEYSIRIILVNHDSVVLPAGTIDYKNMISDSVQMSDMKPARMPNDIAILPYSSGTTGLPKGVQLTHQNLVSNILQTDDPELGYIRLATNDFQEVTPGVLPFFHLYGLVIIMLRGIYNGCKVVTLPKFEAAPFISMLKSHKATVLYAVPPILFLLGNHPMVTPEHLATLQYVVNGAAPVSAADRDKILARSKGNFLFTQVYGLTETSPLVLVSPVSKADFSFLVPVKSTLATVIKPDGTLASPKENGEICFKGPQVMKGYHNKVDATKEAIDENGYFHTGDIGHYNEDGGFRIVDRLKELIKVQGFQVAPAELEAVLRSHPHVEEAAVIGVPDERTGEKPIAFVVKKTDSSVEDQDLQDFVAGKVAPFKKLSKVVFVDSIPKNPSGKILRRIIKAEYLSH